MDKITKSQEKKILQYTSAFLFIAFGFATGIIISNTDNISTPTNETEEPDSLFVSADQAVFYSTKSYCEYYRYGGATHHCAKDPNGVNTGIKCECVSVGRKCSELGYGADDIQNLFVHSNCKEADAAGNWVFKPDNRATYWTSSCTKQDLNICPITSVGPNDEAPIVSSGESGSGTVPAPGNVSLSANVYPQCQRGKSSITASWSRTNTPITTGVNAGAYYYIAVTHEINVIVGNGDAYYQVIKSPSFTSFDYNYILRDNTFAHWNGSKYTGGYLTSLGGDGDYMFKVVWPGIGKDSGWIKFTPSACPIVSTETECVGSTPSIGFTWGPKATKADTNRHYYWVLINDSKVYGTNNAFWYKAVSNVNRLSIRAIDAIKPGLFKYWNGKSSTTDKFSLTPGKQYYYMVTFPGEGNAHTDWIPFTAPRCATK